MSTGKLLLLRHGGNREERREAEDERAGGAEEGTQALIKAYEMQAGKQARARLLPL